MVHWRAQFLPRHRFHARKMSTTVAGINLAIVSDWGAIMAVITLSREFRSVSTAAVRQAMRRSGSVCGSYGEKTGPGWSFTGLSSKRCYASVPVCDESVSVWITQFFG